MIINTIVIDPNALQRMDTVKKSNDHESINLLAEFNSCIEANNFLINTDVDLILLEVDIPKISGFEFLDIINASSISSSLNMDWYVLLLCVCIISIQCFLRYM